MRPRVHPLVLPATVVVLVGCTPDAMQPKLTGVVPSWGYRGGDTEVLVDGRRFFPLVEARGVRDVQVEDGLSLTLGTTPPTPLNDVRRIDDRLLSASVPAGLDPGRYDLTVVGPDGYTDRLEQAFTVTDTQAAFISLSAPQIRADIREDALLELQLRDPSGSDVPAAIEVEVTAVPLNGDGSAIVFRQGLVDQVSLAPGAIRGFLDTGGGADLYFTSTVVDDVAVEVRGLGLNNHLYSVGPQVRFEPSSIADVRFIIDEPDNITAGEPFTVTAELLDDDANSTRGELLVATVQETCSLGSNTYSSVWTIPDRVVVDDVVLTGATVNGSCEENRLRLVGVLNGEAFVVESEPIEVSAGEVVEYDVTPTLPEVTAGLDVQTLLVRAEDAWGNPVPGHDVALSLRDDIGGLDPSDGVGSAACSAFFDGQAVCGVTLERAGSSVEVIATSDDGLSGVSREFSVLANVATSVEVELGSERIVAGASTLVSTQLRDDYGNPAELDALGGAGAVALSDSTASLNCTGRFDGPEVGLLYSLCALTIADPAVVVTASVPAGGFAGFSESVEVVNAEVAVIDVILDDTDFIASESIGFWIESRDAYGNAYVEQSTSTVLLTDQGLELSPTAVALDSDGMGSGAVVLVQATEANRLSAEVFGNVMGTSELFSVRPGPQSGYTVELGTTWVELGESHATQLFAVDAWGNVATTVDTIVDVTSAQGAGDELTQVDVVGGTASVEFLWDTIALQDQLRVTDGTFSGSSGTVDAISFDCVDGPVADLTVSEATELRLCLVGGTTSSTDLSAEQSVEGPNPLVAWHTGDGDGTSTRRSVDLWSMRWRSAGARKPFVVVVDDTGCADLDEVTVWVGAADGEPVGPVEVLVDDDELTAGSSTAGATRVDFAAWDCAGDPSRRGTLGLRADLGRIQSGTSAVTASGSGLQVTLDTNGQASVDWTVSSADIGGEPAIHAGVSNGSAHGSATATVSGDARRPFFVELVPVGQTLDSWSTLVLRASEPMYEPSVTNGAVELIDPDGDEVTISSVTVSDDGQVITITPDAPVDGSRGAYALSLAQSLRDEGGGNRIDGAWVGTASDLFVELGDVSASVSDITSCAANLTRFRPDGDPGPGVEADTVEVTVSAEASPVLWWMVVTDASGKAVHWQPTTGLAASDTLSWDGRGIGGHVLSAGVYSIEISGRDSNFVQGSVCSVVVDVEHPISPPVSQ